MVSRAARVWLPALVVAGVLAVAARHASRPLANPDTWFHLRLGREFLDGWSVRDPGSLTPSGTREWLPTQWLAEVVMAWMQRSLGLEAVAWLSGLQVVVLVLVIAWVCLQRADVLVVAPVLVVTFVACSPALSLRPQVLSYAFAAVAVHGWWRATRTGSPPWLLVPITWGWAMWHGMWPISLLIGAIGVLACVLHRRPRAPEVARHLAVLAACAVAAALTPVGPGLYGAVLHVTGQAEFFREWGPTEFTSGTGLALVLLGVPPLLIWLRRGCEWPEVLFLGLGLALALHSNRTAPLAAVTLAPLAAASLQLLLGPRNEVRWRLPLAAAGTVTLLALALVTSRTDPVPDVLRSTPARALSGLETGTAVLTDTSLGGFVLGTEPHLDPVVHGYGDTFTTAELQRNRDILQLERGWQDLVRDTGAEVAFLPTDHRLAAALEDADWVVVGASADVELLSAPDHWHD